MRKRKYTEEMLRQAVISSVTFAGVIRELHLAQAGGTQAHIARMVKKMGIDTSHFLGQRVNLGKTFPTQRHSADTILTRLPEGSQRRKRHLLRRALLEAGFTESCALCNARTEWNGLSLVLEIDHIDGDFLNNEIGNLRFLCPNCHSQQRTNKPWRKKSVHYFPPD